MREFPLQAAKVQRPPLRETLRRDRLLDWLHAKIHHRIVLVTAEAGYGKTTVLADFARHSRRPTLWYRLDEEDRNWVSFLHYLVAAGRESQPGFAPATRALLGELGAATGPSRDTIVSTFIRELSEVEPGTALIIDDYHAVNDVKDIQDVMGEIVIRAPERLTLVFASRQQPTLPLARLRTLGEVAELTTADLRFDVPETERLFRETYRRPLDADVVSDLAKRTEGWAASLEMVNTALRDRTSAEIRVFVRGLNGAQEELRDYLAEEVVGDLPDDLQGFLMRTALLQSVDEELAEVASGEQTLRVHELIARAERLGLLTRRGRGGRQTRRYHPLVREFLEHRLRRSVGDEAVAGLHQSIARYAAERDWRLAAFHYVGARDFEELLEVVQAAIPSIMGGGEFALAESYLEQTGRGGAGAFELLLSRMELHRGHIDVALDMAEAGLHLALDGDDSTLADYALANLLAVLRVRGEIERAGEVAVVLAERATSPVMRAIADGTTTLDNLSRDGSIDAGLEVLAQMAAEQERRGLIHYVGITWLNIGECLRAKGDGAGALASADRSIQALSETPGGFEIDSARILRGWALANDGRLDEADREFQVVLASGFDVTRAEVLSEVSAAHAWFGDRVLAESLIESAISAAHVSPDIADMIWSITAELALRRGDYAAAGSSLNRVADDRPHATPGFLARFRLTGATLAVAVASDDAAQKVAAARHLAVRQGADGYASAARILEGRLAGGDEFAAAVTAAAGRHRASLSIVAEPIVARLEWLNDTAADLVEGEALSKPTRWREPIRAGLRSGDLRAKATAARILDQIGDATDVLALRRAARALRGLQGTTGYGRGLARRLAPRVFVEDQGRVQVRMKGGLIPGTEIRRKVLALLCFLLTRPNISATRDQVVDALWPETESAVAANSLNQTVYFLRRAFEPSYSEETTPEYVHHDSDVVWLDPELITSRSILARSKMRMAEADPSPENVEVVSASYLGRFALDFLYEDWAVPYRDSLHAAYLEIIEKAVMMDTNIGAFDRAIALARRAIEIDPDAEQIELSLLKLYRRTGAYAAAAEQYGHYAAVLRNDLGIEPPPLDSL